MDQHLRILYKNGNNGQINVTINGGIGPFTYHWENATSTGDSLTGLFSGTYLLTVTDQNGCGTIGDTSVIILEPINVTVMLDSLFHTNATCHNSADGSIQLYASGNAPVTYSWNTGSTSGSVSGLPAGIYVATISDQNTCLVIRDTISQPAAIDISTTINGQTIYANETGATFQWMNCSGNIVITDSTSASFTPSLNGNYKVVITKNNCSDTSACVNVGNNIGIVQVDAPTVSVYPNPGNGLVNLIFSKPVSNARIRLINLIGQVVMEQTGVKGGAFTTDITEYENGIYIFELSENRSVVRTKIVKK